MLGSETHSFTVCFRLQLHGAIYLPDSFVLMLSSCVKLKTIRYESTSLNRIVADKSHRVIVALLVFLFLVPAIPPPNVRLQHYLSTTTLHLRWDAIPTDQANGVLLGYKITYESFKKAGKEVGVAKDTFTKTVDSFTQDLLITNLESFTTYKVTISGYTQPGSGPDSESFYGGKVLFIFVYFVEYFYFLVYLSVKTKINNSSSKQKQENRT